MQESFQTCNAWNGRRNFDVKPRCAATAKKARLGSTFVAQDKGGKYICPGSACGGRNKKNIIHTFCPAKRYDPNAAPQRRGGSSRRNEADVEVFTCLKGCAL
jgi:hypothetical protein